MTRIKIQSQHNFDDQNKRQIYLVTYLLCFFMVYTTAVYYDKINDYYY